MGPVIRPDAIEPIVRTLKKPKPTDKPVAQVPFFAKQVRSEGMLSRVRKALRRPFLAPFSYPAMNPNTERELRQRYLPDVQKLEAMIGRDPSCWYPRGARNAARQVE